MVHGARSVLRTAKSKEDRLSQWAVRLAERSHPNVAAIALANKTARMFWAMLRHGAYRGSGESIGDKDQTRFIVNYTYNFL